MHDKKGQLSWRVVEIILKIFVFLVFLVLIGGAFHGVYKNLQSVLGTSFGRLVEENGYLIRATDNEEDLPGMQALRLLALDRELILQQLPEGVDRCQLLVGLPLSNVNIYIDNPEFKTTGDSSNLASTITVSRKKNDKWIPLLKATIQPIGMGVIDERGYNPQLSTPYFTIVKGSSSYNYLIGLGIKPEHIRNLIIKSVVKLKMEPKAFSVSYDKTTGSLYLLWIYKGGIDECDPRDNLGLDTDYTSCELKQSVLYYRKGEVHLCYNKDNILKIRDYICWIHQRTDIKKDALKIWDKEQGKWISLEELIEKENLCENGGRNIQKN